MRRIHMEVAVWLWFDGFDPARDKRMRALAQALGGWETGTGFALEVRVRDQSFGFPSWQAAEEFIQTAKRDEKVKKARIRSRKEAEGQDRSGDTQN